MIITVNRAQNTNVGMRGERERERVAAVAWKLSAVWRALFRKATPSLVCVSVCASVCACCRTLLSSSSHPLEQPRPSGGSSRPLSGHPIHSPYRSPLHSITDQYIGVLFLKHFLFYSGLTYTTRNVWSYH